MDFDKIVERKLWLVDSNDGRRVDLCIEIGRPRWREPEIEAVCPVCIRGLMSEPLNIFGSDLFSALECGLDFIKTELKNLPTNQVVQWPGGESYFD
jgi:hypothetical protein